MTINDEIRNIGSEISAARNTIPFQNRRKFDFEANEHYLAIVEAINAGKTERAAAILERWKERVWWLQNSPHCHVAPPALVRRLGETLERFNERRAAAWRKL